MTIQDIDPSPGPAADSAWDADPRRAVAALAASARPYLLGVRHHSPALAVALPALLDAADAEVVCVELPADFQQWLVHLADPGTIAPVALAGARGDGGLGFYPFADFSPELVAIRWAWKRGAEVLCCDLPLSDPGWHATDPSPLTGPGEDAGPPTGLGEDAGPPTGLGEDAGPPTGPSAAASSDSDASLGASEEVGTLAGAADEAGTSADAAKGSNAPAAPSADPAEVS
ncbi:DUF5682 family protein, partial [Nonomuraea guangzhouensis]